MTNLRRLYVYTLVDLRDGKVFNVGKGLGDRIHQHEKDCRADRVLNGPKHRLVADIIASGATVHARKVKVRLTEGEAIDAEKALIRSIGIRNLTNVFAGQNSVNSQLVEVTKIRCAQCRQTIELGRRVGYLDPDWLSAEMEYREISSKNTAPVLRSGCLKNNQAI